MAQKPELGIGNQVSDVQWAFDQGRASGITNDVVDDIRIPFVLLGDKATSLEHLLVQPTRRRAKVEFSDRESFCGYVNEFSAAATQIFADVRTRRIEAILDYHHEQPGWGDHRAALGFVHSTAWDAWMGLPATQWQCQQAFAEHLEDHLSDITLESPAKLVQVVRHLEVTSSKKWASAVSGGGLLTLTAESGQKIEGPGQVEIPVSLDLGIQVFETTPLRPVRVRVQHRCIEGKVEFRVSAAEREDLVRREFRSECNEIEKALVPEKGGEDERRIVIRYGTVRSMGA